MEPGGGDLPPKQRGVGPEVFGKPFMGTLDNLFRFRLLDRPFIPSFRRKEQSGGLPVNQEDGIPG